MDFVLDNMSPSDWDQVCRVYAGVAEISLYVGATYRGQGVGSSLLSALIKASEEAGIWTLQGGIFPENTASLALVKKHGFREVGRRERLGKMTYGERAGTWRDGKRAPQSQSPRSSPAACGRCYRPLVPSSWRTASRSGDCCQGRYPR